MTTHHHTAWFNTAEELLNNLGSLFADRAFDFDTNCMFVQKNYKDLQEARFFSLAIPVELGGAGLTYSELCQVTQQLGQYCGSTALAFAMHSHPVALNVYKAQRGDTRAQATLQKIASQELIIAGTGANDWLESNGTAQAVDGGYLINAHKRFVSGGPGAQVLVSSVNHQGAEGAEVIHFSLPMSSAGIRVQNNWKTLGMRGTGSNDIVLENVFLPEQAIVARRPAGVWHPIWDTLLPIAMPLITACYLGLAEKAFELARTASTGNLELASLLGTLHNQLTTAQLALEDMVRCQDNYGFTPSRALTNAILTRKTIANQAIRNVVEQAAVLVGGSGFFQGHPLERIVRDVRAMHFHPLPEHKQVNFSGRLLMGLDPISL
ncbi:acyl-CoA dehydrogenase family protein [Ketobacter sp.]|uniref:acyl-CoA dehydrogenase family protein n=1 Tax=Ketobacter sp. TaxID=2083498 RepID=UPI000F101999|nr:acyl-CoA dehydrogenase family protein [Ketobacter sp.]RLT94748.1 MAG: acyl-CoA dehydrogenase [Ketobacter sp.]